ncbi:MAG TPA: peptide ABC transporter substrate-binding protein [Candidatus Limnocylindrales bacterium]|nr:peptide ABC transporter substrate-binding protein [Candidatus Limnocylindrales bacterium]
MRRRLAILLVALIAGACGNGPSGASDDGTARILIGSPTTFDPAIVGDAQSGAVINQFFEPLTTVDPSLELRPALAESWRMEEDGRRIVFRLRPNLRFSDGTPLRASDVVRSWLRVIDPEGPSPLATLLLDVRGAREYLAGEGSADGVGLTAADATNEVVVELLRPAADFPAIVAGSTFGVVPPGIDEPRALDPGHAFVASGGYRPVSADASAIVLAANPEYWAGRPALPNITLVTDVGGKSPVAVFEGGDLDYAPVSPSDATWIAYDRTLGPQLRATPSLSTDYYGFNVKTPPFDDVRVRQAFAAAVDWRRISTLAVPDPAMVGTSMVPPGIPGRSDRDVVPKHDPEAARALLADAGFPGGRGFPDVTLTTGGNAYDEAVVGELRRELGITVQPEVMDFDAFFERLDSDAPAMWFLSWVADYPGRNDFLGVLLSTGASNNYGNWTSAEFDAVIADAGAATDEAVASAAFDRAEDIVQRDVPVIPMSYGSGWALSRDGLLGASENGLGGIRLAGLTWDR